MGLRFPKQREKIFPLNRKKLALQYQLLLSIYI